METIRQDLHYAVRRLVSRPGFSAFAVLTLALGIGANTAIFSMVNAVLLRPLALREPERVVTVWESREDMGQYPMSIPDFLDLQAQSHTFERMAALANWSANLSGEETPERVMGVQASADFFETLGARAEMGRLLEPADAQPGSARVCVLSHGFWKRHYAGHPRVAGKTVRLNGEMYTVVGVLPGDFFYRQLQDDVIVPLVFEQDPRREQRNNNFLRGFGRLKEGVTAGQAREDLTGILRRLQAEYPATNGGKNRVTLEVLQNALVGDVKQGLVLLFAAVLAVPLISCANLAGLLLVRASRRMREVAIRVSVGATRARIVRLLLTESMVLSGAGGLAGLGLAAAGMRVLPALSPATLVRASEIGMDWRVLGFTLGISLLCGLIFGVAPAIELSRVSLNEEMKAGGRGGAGGTRQGLRQMLVVAQVAASLVLLVASGLLLESFLRLGRVHPGFNAANVLVMRLALPKTQYRGNGEVFRFYRALADRVERLPGVRRVAVANVVPTDGFLAAVEFSIVGRGDPPANLPSAHYRMVTPEYFRTLEIPLAEGREFEERDNAEGAGVVIINQTFARKYWPGASPLGAHIRIDDLQTGTREVEIVGVVGDVHDFGLDHDTKVEVFTPIAQVSADTVAYLKNNMYWLVRTGGEPLMLAGAFRREVQAVDRDVPATSAKTLEQYLEQSTAPQRFNATLVGIFAAAALVIASMGIYGVISYLVVQRTREIGIRLALGAQPGTVFGLVLAHGLRLVGAGVGAGLVAAVVMARMIASMLFGTSATDPATYAGVSAVLVTVGIAACYLPARRAMAVDPLSALRHE